MLKDAGVVRGPLDEHRPERIGIVRVGGGLGDGLPTTHQTGHGEIPFAMQALFDAAIGSGAPSEALWGQLAQAGETEALIALWDRVGAGGRCAAATAAVSELHARGKGRIPAGRLTVPTVGVGKRLSPARRLHKIAKGAVMRRRSEAAKAHVAAGVEWVRARQAEGRDFAPCRTARGRVALQKELRTALGLRDAETARGLVTKLKQMRVL